MFYHATEVAGYAFGSWQPFQKPNAEEIELVYKMVVSIYSNRISPYHMMFVLGKIERLLWIAAVLQSSLPAWKIHH